MSNPSPPTVMVVDDEEMIVTALESLLILETDFRVLTFTSPLAALAAMSEERIHLVCADFMMPEMDGITLLKKARVKSPETTRVLLTGYADKESAIRGINDAGLYHFMEKPWDNEHLKLVIRNGVERSIMVDELDVFSSDLDGAQTELRELHKKLVRAFL